MAGCPRVEPCKVSVPLSFVVLTGRILSTLSSRWPMQTCLQWKDPHLSGPSRAALGAFQLRPPPSLPKDRGGGDLVCVTLRHDRLTCLVSRYNRSISRTRYSEPTSLSRSMTLKCGSGHIFFGPHVYVNVSPGWGLFIDRE